MTVRWITGVLDAPDTSADGFWQAVTSSELSARGMVLLPRDGDPYLRVRVVGDGPARTGLELHADDVPALVRRAAGLGAVRVPVGGDPAGDDLVVLRSPAGLVFGVVAWSGQRVRPAPVGMSLVDQVCLDVPVAGFEAEAGFWSALTGWPRRAAGLPEFEFLVRPDGVPLRLLLQRTGGVRAGMHLDLACADVPAEVARQVALGASVVRRVPGDWTTLRDPAGREYCVTARWPG